MTRIIAKPRAPAARSLKPNLLKTGYPSAKRLEWVSYRKLIDDTLKLGGQLPASIAGVAGIPRSGMIPASILATQLQLPLYEVERNGGLRRLGHGSRGAALGFGGDPTGPIVVVDDTVYSGQAMRRVRPLLAGQNVQFAAVYCRPEAADVVDVYGRQLPSPHLLEWNLFNSGALGGFAIDPVLHGGFATDFDGILCQDPPQPDADEGPECERYRDWLVNAPPLFLPRTVPVKLIVTYRLERWRTETEEWLTKRGVRWKQLVMYPAATAAERDAGPGPAVHKARVFAESDCAFFVESDVAQARAICKRAGKPVICPAAERIWV